LKKSLTLGGKIGKGEARMEIGSLSACEGEKVGGFIKRYNSNKPSWPAAANLLGISESRAK